MDGILQCSRYAFGPNRLHYCGPDANREIFSYIDNEEADYGLEMLLKRFKTMFPYLDMIARSNQIQDAFDRRVVEAYWIGNELLDAAAHKNLFNHLYEDGRVKKRLNKKNFEVVVDKVYQGAVPHHSFHVLDIWKRTGHLDADHNIESLDSCLIKSGVVQSAEGPFVEVMTETLIEQDGKLRLSDPHVIRISRPFEANIDIENLQNDDIVSYHWGVICEVVDEHQAARLRDYTIKHLELANKTM